VPKSSASEVRNNAPDQGTIEPKTHTIGESAPGRRDRCAGRESWGEAVTAIIVVPESDNGDDGPAGGGRQGGVCRSAEVRYTRHAFGTRTVKPFGLGSRRKSAARSTRLVSFLRAVLDRLGGGRVPL
jgi:hypothetical protein